MTPLLIALGLVLMSPPSATLPRPQAAPCQAPALALSKQPNLFSDAQESDLGDAMAERTERDVRLIDDPGLTAELTRIGARLVRHLPPTKLNIRFALIDLPEANAFVVPGGRVYVSRKLVGFTQREDELAGVLAHELGHLVARQMPIAFSRLWREVLGVTQVGDRADVFDKYNRYMDTIGRKPNALRALGRHEDKDQVEADQLGLFVLAAAGYDPQATVTLYDRLSETRGKTGGFFSDLFGVTSPESRRLKGMIKAIATLPPACVEPRPAAAGDAYRRWQASVIGFTAGARTAVLHNVLSTTALSPPLRAEVTHLRFSPDGRSVLAQDDSGITVLSRAPFVPLFRIPSTPAGRAQFTPDAAGIVFQTADLRVERWSIADRALAEVHDLVVRALCLQTALAPDGRTLACLDGDAHLTLVDVATGAQIVQKKNFYDGNPLLDVIRRQGEGVIAMEFSPDGRLFAAGWRSLGRGPVGPQLREGALVVDVRARAAVPIKYPVARLLAGGFAFLGTDRVVAFNEFEPAKSALLTLPSGAVVDEFPLTPGLLSTATKGHVLFIRPFQKYAVGVFDIAKREVTKGLAHPAVDVLDDVYVAERASGDLALAAMAGNVIQASVALPQGPLGQVRAAAVSPDLGWLAISDRSRGAIWDLARGERVLHTRAFQGGYFDGPNVLFADFPKTADEGRKMARITPATRDLATAAGLQDGEGRQAGSVMLVHGVESSRPGLLPDVVTLNALDVADASVLWKKRFTKDMPLVFPSDRSGTLVLAWPAGSATAKDEAKFNPQTARALAALENTDGDYLLQVFDARTGGQRGALVIETTHASFSISDVVAVDDWVAVEDRNNRVLIYALSSGERKGQVFGDAAAIAPGAGLLKVGNGDGRVAIYDLTTMTRRDDFTFAHRVALTRFSQDGRKLLVVTEDQVAHVIDIGVK